MSLGTGEELHVEKAQTILRNTASQAALQEADGKHYNESCQRRQPVVLLPPQVRRLFCGPSTLPTKCEL
ncbi:Nesprin-1 [Manis javanica]|nr:Nesprin-1 [Manis javanica]